MKPRRVVVEAGSALPLRGSKVPARKGSVATLNAHRLDASRARAMAFNMNPGTQAMMNELKEIKDLLRELISEERT